MDKDLEIKRRLVVLLDELLEKDYWQDSLFLQAAEQEIRGLRAKIVADSQLMALLGESQLVKQPVKSVSANLLQVYVALYQSDGNNFTKWAQMLSAISSLSISRPIYRYERDIKSCMRGMEKKLNHAYAIVSVKSEDILSDAGNPPKDRNSYELLMIKERAIQANNIISFLHLTGRYTFENGTLIHQENVDFNE